MSRQKLLRGNLIGKSLQVGTIYGTIVDETKHMIIIKSGDMEKKIVKGGHKFKIDGHEINGEDLVGRTEERIRNKSR